MEGACDWDLGVGQGPEGGLDPSVDEWVDSQSGTRLRRRPILTGRNRCIYPGSSLVLPHGGYSGLWGPSGRFATRTTPRPRRTSRRKPASSEFVRKGIPFSRSDRSHTAFLSLASSCCIIVSSPHNVGCTCAGHLIANIPSAGEGPSIQIWSSMTIFPRLGGDERRPRGSSEAIGAQSLSSFFDCSPYADHQRPSRSYPGNLSWYFVSRVDDLW